MLGPVRFTHIEDCTRQVCDQIILKDEMDDCLATLVNLDSTLTALRAELDILRRGPQNAVTTVGHESESAPSSQPLPPWFQKEEPSGTNLRKRSRSPEPHAVDQLNSDASDHELPLHVSKRSRPSESSERSLPSTQPSVPKGNLESFSPMKPNTAQDYSAMQTALDVKKARRLLTARENAVKGVKALIAKEKEKADRMSTNPAAKDDEDREKDGFSTT